jgi:N-acetylmuramoyl-L-alanine amidase
MNTKKQEPLSVRNALRSRTVLVTLLLLLMTTLSNAFDTVVIDPGHGGKDEGTAWYHVKEKDTTLAVALRLETLLEENGINCILTRRTDSYMSLDERAEIGNRHPHSLLVSIHFDGSRSASAAGFSTYYFSESPSGRFVAQIIQDALNESYSTRNLGIHSQNYAVLVRTLGCAVLVECGFLSNKAEAGQFASAEGQQWLAEALSLGILRAQPLIIDDPPETQIAKCEAYAKHLDEKERQRHSGRVTPAKSVVILKPKKK